jgi:uncharacterized membrane protein YgaE (UPF0421/DUF939 family)
MKLLKGYQINLLKILKIALGSSIAIIIADVLGLQYSASAGIITLLSIQDTKKETLTVAFKRMIAFLYAIFVAYILFQSLGYYTIVFGLFLLLFISGSYLFRIQDGISMCSVLVTHFLIEKTMDPSFIGNELLIMLIGTTVGIIINLYMPKSIEAVKADIKLVEDEFRKTLKIFGSCILANNDCNMRLIVNTEKDSKDLEFNKNRDKYCSLEDDFIKIDSYLSNALSRAYNNMNNTLLSDTRYYIQYFMMRKSQFEVIKGIKEQLCMLTDIPKQALTLSKFINKIADQFHEFNNAENLLRELNQIKISYKNEPNPVTRDEFENRAILYVVLSDLENFLVLKRNFVKNMDEKQLEKYWKMNH